MENVINTHQIDHICTDIETFKDYFLEHNYNSNMFNSDGTLNKNYNSFKKTGLIAQIFEDHWNNIPFDESCKYTTLLYYILCPYESKTKINESIEEIYSGDNTRVGNASDVKTLIITSDMQKDGRFIRLTYTRR